MLIDILNWYPWSILDQHSINTYSTAVDSRPRLVSANSSIDRKLVDSRLSLDQDVDRVSTEVFIEWQLRCSSSGNWGVHRVSTEVFIEWQLRCWLSVNWGFDGMYHLCLPLCFLCYGIKKLCFLLLYYGTPCALSEKGQVSCGIFHGIITKKKHSLICIYNSMMLWNLQILYTICWCLYFCHSLSHF